MFIQELSRGIFTKRTVVLLKRSTSYFFPSPARCWLRVHKFCTQTFELQYKMCTGSAGIPPIWQQFMKCGTQNISFQRFYAKGAIVKERKGKGSKPKVLLTDDEMNEIVVVDDIRNEMKQVISSVRENYIKHITLRSPGNIEDVLIDIDGEKFPLNELAQISRKNPQLVVLNMTGFPEGLKPTIKALQDSGMDLNPQQDGTMIYVPLPKITREHRENLAKNCKMIFQKAKDEIRDIQNKYLKEVRSHKDDFSKDFIFNAEEQIKIFAVSYVAEGEKLMVAKQKELLGEE